MTPDEATALELLKAALPPIHEGRAALRWLAIYAEATPWGDPAPLCIDCEWDEDSGALTTIGIGNERHVAQIDWSSLDNLDRIEVRDAVERLVRKDHVVYHNADADIRKLRQHGFEISAACHHRLDDTMLADAVLNSEEAHDLGDLNRRLGKLPDFKHLRKVAPREYNAGDLVSTVLIWKYGLAPAFEADPAAHFVYRTMSLPFIDIAIEGEEAGIRVNAPIAVVLRAKYAAKVEQARRLAVAYTGDPTFNLGSPDQVKHWLYNVYGLPIQREKAYRDELGKVTTDKDALAALRRLQGTEWDEGEEPTLESALANIEVGGHGLLEAKYLFGGAQQRLTHYVLPCFDVDEPRVRIYPELRQHVQATGRHSYVGPALQQMKGDTAELILPDPGTVWVKWDWAQIEVRLLAALAGDQPYLDAFARGDDIHELNVRAIFGAPGSKELEAIRRGFGKRYVFRLHYRGKPENAGDIPGTRALGLGVDQLVGASEVYLGQHPAIPVYWQEIEQQADRRRVVYTFMGRPRRLTSEFRNARNREASNMPMQGGVADIYATTAILIKAAAPWARLVFGAHDAQTWQVPVEREIEFLMLAAPIVNRPFVINGRAISFPAEFKRKTAG